MFKIRSDGNSPFSGIDAMKGEDYKPVSTSNLNNISNPKVGTMVFYTTINKPVWYSGTSWITADGTSV